MYKIKYNDAVICTPQFKKFAAIAGTLQEGLNAVSVFSFTLPPKHLYLDSIEGRNGLVKLYDDDNVLFIGDIVNRKENFDCTTEIECQDALGWLNDVVFVKPTFSGAIENYWAYLLGRYNQEASEWRKINIGTVTVQGNISIAHDTEFLTIFDLVSELTKLAGGYVSVRYEGEEIFLDYLSQTNTASDQSILFGTNLINLEDFVSEEQIFSRIYPRGKDGLDISSVNGGLTFLTNGITESMFGIVAVTVDFDTESATELKALGQAYLEANGLASRTLTLTAFDLSLVDKKYTEIKVGNIIPVISPLHGINTKMQVNAKTTDIVTPENSIFTLGLILNTISGIMSSGGGTSKTVSGQVTPPTEITGAVRYDIAQTLIDSEKARARANIGAGTSNFDGRYSSLSGKPTIPTKTSDLTNDSGFGTYSKPAGGIPESDLSTDVKTKLNLIGTFRINVTYSNGAYSADRTFDEIKAAYDAGQQPYVVYGGNTIYTLSYCYFASEQMFMDFERYLIGGDTLETETLRIYSYTLASGSNIEQRIAEFNVPNGTTYVKVSSAGSVITTVNGETYSDIKTLINAGKPVVVRYNDVLDFYYFETFGLSDSSGTHKRLNFRCVMGSIVYTLALKDDNTWAFSETSLQPSSITDTGGYFTTDTVEGALQEIGAELAGINTLLGSGIQISFTIDDGSEVNTFSAVSGETWKEWIGGYSRVISETSGLTLYCYSDDGIIFADEAGVNALGLNDVWVHGNETIVSGATYAIIPCGG